MNYKLWNRMRDPGDGSLHQVALFANLRYGGNNQWCYDEDIYNTAEMTKMVTEWNAAKQAVARGGSSARNKSDTAAKKAPPTACGGEQCRQLNSLVTAMRDIVLCCTEDDQCGVELIGCMPMDVPGVVDESCPTSSLSGMIPVDGCCNEANECGIVLDFMNLGCVENSLAARIALDDELTPRTCSSG